MNKKKYTTPQIAVIGIEAVVMSEASKIISGNREEKVTTVKSNQIWFDTDDADDSFWTN